MTNFGIYFKILIILSCFLLLTGCASGRMQEQKEADLSFQLGISYLNEGNYQQAYLHFQKSHSINPKNKETLNSLGLIHMHFEDLQKARGFFLDAINLDSNFSKAYNNLGIVYIKMSMWNEAIEQFKKALSNPMYQNPETAYFNLGNVYYKLGKYELAITAYKDSIKRAPSFAHPYYGLALSYNKIGRYGEASDMLTIAIEIDPAYKGDRVKFVQEIQKNYLRIENNDQDFEDYLEIINY